MVALTDEHAPPKQAGLDCDGGNLIDIHTHLKWLRENYPIAEMAIEDYFGVPRTEQYKDVKEFTVFDYETAKTILIDDKRFSTRCYALQMDLKRGAPTMLSMDDPEHRKHRSLVSAAFFNTALDTWVNESIPSIVHDLLGTLPKGNGSVDFVRHFTYTIPIQVIVGLIGVPREDVPKLLPLVEAQLKVGAYPEEGMKASAELLAYLGEIVKERRAAPKADLASTLVAAEVDGDRLSDPAIKAFLMLLLTAGADTAARVLGILITALLQDLPQFEAVKKDRSLIRRAIEEAMRWESPIVQLRRLVVQDTEFHGVALPAGSHVSINISSANRDPQRWPDPDRFNIFREEKRNLSFGLGPHVCIGVHLARQEIEVALNAFLDRVENPRPTHELPSIQGMILRSPKQIHLSFDAIHSLKH